MHTLAPELRLDNEIVDTVHEEFVSLIETALLADDADFLSALDAWIAHTRQHFEREERWMAESNFGPQYCHASEHQEVLAVAAAMRKQIARDGQVEKGRQLLRDISVWFDHHVRTMDAMMVGYLREYHFEPFQETEDAQRP